VLALVNEMDLSVFNGIVESLNTRIRLITRMAFDFKDPTALIALAMLSLGGHRPHPPGRQTA
jgi:transposase